MFLFSRVATPNGSPRDVMALATEMTDYVNSTVPTHTTLWQGLFGGPVGSMIWNTLVRSRSEMGQTMMTLMADDGYHDLLDRYGSMRSEVNPTHDYLAQFIFGDTDEKPAEIGAVAEMVTAVPAGGRIADVMAWGPQIAQLVGRISGTMPSFWVSVYGPFGQVNWITIQPSLEALDEAHDSLMNSEEYMTEVVKGGELFVDGSGQRTAAMRLH